MFEWFGKGGIGGGEDSGSADVNISAFMDLFNSDGPKAKPAKNGWSPLPGSAAGGVYELTSEKIFWPSEEAAAKDAKVFKGHYQKAKKEAEAFRAKGDMRKALASETLAGYCYRVGTGAFAWAKPEYFTLPEREAQMAHGESAGAPPSGGIKGGIL